MGRGSGASSVDSAAYTMVSLPRGVPCGKPRTRHRGRTAQNMTCELRRPCVQGGIRLFAPGLACASPRALDAVRPMCALVDDQAHEPFLPASVIESTAGETPCGEGLVVTEEGVIWAASEQRLACGWGSRFALFQLGSGPRGRSFWAGAERGRERKAESGVFSSLRVTTRGVTRNLMGGEL